jgi:ADP-L-glycero-D-manno-heptose 6-epimerase
MIIVTGASGFVGANIVSALNAQGEKRIVAVDIAPNAQRYLDALRIAEFVERDALPAWLELNAGQIRAVIHMGACSDTTNADREFMMRNNYDYSCTLWKFCAQNRIRFVYASSAATYGDGSLGYDDRSDPKRLKPLNLYGESKQRFDLWALAQAHSPAGWAGLKFFNVYGPRESHKGRMASVVFHAFNQIKAGGSVKLFASDRPDIPDGGQKRDFIYVNDVVAAVLYCTHAAPEKINSLFNVGTGHARSFADLARAVFKALQLEPNIEYIPMPEDLKDKYQYFTEAKMDKLWAAGLRQPLHSLEDGVSDYVKILTASQP